MSTHTTATRVEVEVVICCTDRWPATCVPPQRFRQGAYTGGVASEAALKAKGICCVWAVDTACANFEEVEWLQARSNTPYAASACPPVCVIWEP